MFKLITVRKRMPAWVNQGYEEYAKRFPREFKPQLIEVPLAERGKNTSITQTLNAEAKNITKQLSPGDVTIALAINGKMWSTEDLAQNLSTWRVEQRPVNFIIGGPDGLSDDCLEKAQIHWSLSKLTLPHPLVPLVFIEQWYRAYSLLINHPYHRA